MSVRTLGEEFAALDDPRCRGKVEHRLIDILVIAVCAVIAGAASWEDIALYGRSKIGWLGTFLALPNGIPAHDTFRRVFMLIDTGRFERCFEAWVRSFGAPVNREVIAIDGKTIRGSCDRGREPGPLHVVSAWACDRGLVLGQHRVGDKSNEISAIPELLEVLDIKGTIVTLDAMGCQRAIATRILKNGADYLMTLKANQGKKFTAVRELCAATCFGRSPLHRPIHDKFDDSHGRLVRRRVFVCPEAPALEPLRDWPGLQIVLAVESIRQVNGSGKIETDIRYFLSSSADHPEILAQAIRRHWQIENSLHWVLDVVFQEDHCRMRDRNAVQNFALLRKIAINLVRRHQTAKASLKGRRLMAAWDNRYMEQVLTGIFHA
jgi:predicted transposase YbfD/YdcC